MVCISCNTEHGAKFCPNCGEKSGIKKITFKSTFEEAFSTVTNMDKGFLYNIKTLLIEPKTISTYYLLGKRKGILNPISFLILSVTMYLITESLLRVPTENLGAQNLPEDFAGKVAYATGKYVHSYFKYFWILSIIPLSVSTRFFFRKYNFFEHLAISSFMLGQATLLGLILYIILRIDMVVNPIVYLYLFWLLFHIYRTKKDRLDTILMSFVALVLFIVQLIVIAIGIGFIMA